MQFDLISASTIISCLIAIGTAIAAILFWLHRRVLKASAPEVSADPICTVLKVSDSVHQPHQIDAQTVVAVSAATIAAEEYLHHHDVQVDVDYSDHDLGHDGSDGDHLDIED
jgi:hypothetical protein